MTFPESRFVKLPNPVSRSKLQSRISLPSFFQNPESRASKKPNPGSRKTYWGPSINDHTSNDEWTGYSAALRQNLYLAFSQVAIKVILSVVLGLGHFILALLLTIIYNSIQVAKTVFKHNFSAALYTMAMHSDAVGQLDDCPVIILVGKSGKGKTHAMKLGSNR